MSVLIIESDLYSRKTQLLLNLDRTNLLIPVLLRRSDMVSTTVSMTSAATAHAVPEDTAHWDAANENVTWSVRTREKLRTEKFFQSVSLPP